MPLVDSFRIPGRAEGPILAARQFQIFFGQTFTPDRLVNIFSSVTCVLKWMKDDRVGFPPSFQLATHKYTVKSEGMPSNGASG